MRVIKILFLRNPEINLFIVGVIALLFQVSYAAEVKPPLTGDKPIVEVSPIIAEDEVEISQVEFLKKVNEESPKLSYYLVGTGLDDRIGSLEKAVPNTTAPVPSTPPSFKSYQEPATAPAKPIFRFFLPPHSSIRDYLDFIQGDLLTSANNDTDFQFKLATVLGDTTKFINYILRKDTKKLAPIIKTLEELEYFLYNNFNFDRDTFGIGKSTSLSNSNETTLLFASIDLLRKIDAKVYLPSKQSIIDFLKNCATERGKVADSTGNIKFMQKILELLATDKDTDTQPVGWADLLEGSEKFFFKHQDIVYADSAIAGGHQFKYGDLRSTACIFKSDKIYISFDKVPQWMTTLELYLQELSKSNTAGPFDNAAKRKRFGQLIVDANDETIFQLHAINPPDYRTIEAKPVTYEELLSALQDCIKEASFDVFISDLEFCPPDSATTRSVSYANGQIKFAQLAYLVKVEEGVEPDSKQISGYIEFIKQKIVGKLSRGDVIKRFFELCWNDSVVSEYTNELKKALPAESLPQKKKGRNRSGGGGGTTTKETDQRVPILITCTVFVLLIILVVGPFALAQRKKHQEEAKRS